MFNVLMEGVLLQVCLGEQYVNNAMQSDVTFLVECEFGLSVQVFMLLFIQPDYSDSLVRFNIGLPIVLTCLLQLDNSMHTEVACLLLQIHSVQCFMAVIRQVYLFFLRWYIIIICGSQALILEERCPTDPVILILTKPC